MKKVMSFFIVLIICASIATTAYADSYDNYYSIHGALAYAEHWYDSYNPAYRQYDTDCTNFISQCITEGGGIPQSRYFSPDGGVDNWHPWTVPGDLFTYLTRDLGVSTYTLLLIIICFLIRRTNARTKNVLIFYTIAVFVMGYFYVPNPEADLARLLPIMRYYSTYSINQIWEAMKKYSTPGEPLYYYLISKLGSDSLMPALTGLITYGLCFNILYRCSQNIEVSRYDIGLALYIFMSRGLLIHVISGIRNQLAFAIISWCVYMELMEGKKVVRDIPLYIIAASMHTMGQVFLLYRLLFLFIERNDANPLSKLWKIIVGIVSLSMVYFIGRGYIEGISNKATNYYTRAVLGTGYSYIWERVLSIIALLIAIYLVIVIRTIIKKHQLDIEYEFRIKIRNVLLFIVPIVCIDAISFFVEFNFFHRTSNLLTMLSIPLSMVALKLAELYGNKKKVILTLVILSSAMLLLAVTRGNLCSLKFFE